MFRLRRKTPIPAAPSALAPSWRPRRRFVAVAAAALLGVVPLAQATSARATGPFTDYTPPRTTNLSGCPEVALVGFRGSGEPFDDGLLGLGSPIRALYDSLAGRLGSANIGASAASYPAVPWLIGTDRLDLWLASIPVFFKNIFRGRYADSVSTGVNDGLSDITHLTVRCPATKIVVSGYSQGAETARRVLAGLNSKAGSRITAVALFGDASYLAGEGGVYDYWGSPGMGVSRHRFASTMINMQLRYAGKVITDCHYGDLVCRGVNGSSLTPHMTYGSAGDISAVTAFLMNRLRPPATPTKQCEALVADLTVPDGTSITAGSTFTKGWRLRNCGKSNWSDLKAVRIDGTFGPSGISVPNIAPGATTDVYMTMTAPKTAGHYRSTYRLLAGNGTYATNSFWVDINAVGTAAHDCEAFVADVTIPDGTVVTAGSTITKIWRLRNCGTTNWSGLTAVRLDGTYGPPTFAVPVIAPGATADLTVTMQAPTTPGTARATYRFQAADGHYADNSFWVEINAVAAVSRTAITSYNRMQPGAPYHGYFDVAWQPFTAASNRITVVGATVGNPTLTAGVPVGANLLLRVCTSPSCTSILAQASPQIVNYGSTQVDLGDVPVTSGATYYLVWYQPAAVNGATWVTYWWAGGSTISASDQLQALVFGYNV